MVLSRTGIYLRWGLLGFLMMPVTVLGLQVLGHNVSLWRCPLKALTGIPCPTWGMTRSVVAIATLHPHQSLHHHLFGPLILILAPLLVFVLAKELYTRHTASIWKHLQQLPVWGSVLLVILIYHGHRLAVLWAAGTLQTDVYHSPLGHLVSRLL